MLSCDAVSPSISWYTTVIKESGNEYHRSNPTRLRPKNDYIFQRLFGEEETKESLLSLLNAILRLAGEDRLVDIKIMPSQLQKEHLEDKTGRLDIRAETMDGVQIDIEMQLTDERNMDRRTLFYFGKLFLESIRSGGMYHNLKKTITINILDFTFLGVERFQSTFHLYEDHEKDFMLTDVMEIHFIECPKFRASSKDLNDPLHRWLLFLEEELAEELMKELKDMDPVIKNTEERLAWLSSDEETRRLYEFRENSRIERNSLIFSAKEEGREEGKKEIAKRLLKAGMSPEQIAEITDLPIDEVK